MSPEIEEQIRKKRVPALVGMVAKLEALAFAAEAEAKAARGKADAARAELQRLLGEPAPAPAAVSAPPDLSPLCVRCGLPQRDLAHTSGRPDACAFLGQAELLASTCPDPDIMLPRPPVLSDLARELEAELDAAPPPAPRVGPKDDHLAEAGRRGYAVGQEETLARVAGLLNLEEGDPDKLWDDIEANISDLHHAIAKLAKVGGIADHVVPPAPAARAQAAPAGTWAECLCDEIDPSDRPCPVCEARQEAGDKPAPAAPPEARPARQASGGRHLLKGYYAGGGEEAGRGEVVCGRDPKETRGMRTSNAVEVTCPDCLNWIGEQSGAAEQSRRLNAEPAAAPTGGGGADGGSGAPGPVRSDRGPPAGRRGLVPPGAGPAPRRCPPGAAGRSPSMGPNRSRWCAAWRAGRPLWTSTGAGGTSPGSTPCGAASSSGGPRHSAAARTPSARRRNEGEDDDVRGTVACRGRRQAPIAARRRDG